ncbi:MAG: hypothetical protein Q9159_005975 [Coniocarpon cinnabarinum]
MGQLADGQNRIGQGLPPAQYCIDNGAITDSTHKGCILTPPTTQFQCDQGATPQPGFAVNSSSSLTYNGSPNFFACQTGDHGGMNIYTSDSAGQVGCVPIALSASSCAAPAPAPPPPPPSSSPPPPPPPTSTSVPPTSSPSACSDVLTGAYEYPHLIIHADSANPTSASGTSYNGIASPSVSSLFNFDIPSSDAGKTCSLVFLLPNKDELTTSSYNMTGSGQIDFGMLAAVANQGTSFSNMPAMKQDFGVKTVSPGNSYVVASFACPQGQAVGFEMKSVGETALEWFEDYNAPGLGLYITTC